MEDKRKGQLIAEIESLRREVAELEQEKAERKRARRLLQALNQASESMERTLTPDEIFSAVKGQLKKLGFSSIVFLTDESQKRLFLKYWSYEAAAIRVAEKLVGLKHEDFPILVEAVDVYRKTIRERETVFVENVKDVIEQLFQAVLPGPAKKLNGPIAKVLKVSKAIDAPLIVGDKVIGMLSVQSDNLTAGDVPAITAFAHSMAAAWRKATLLQDLKRSLAERKRAEEALQKTHNELERRVEERTAELLNSNEQLTREITERKQAEEELQHSKKRFQTLFNIMVDPVVIVDDKGKFLEVTDRVEEITGFKKEDLLGRNFMRTNIVTAKSKAIMVKNLVKRMTGMKIAPYEVEVLRKDGRKLPYELNAAKIEYEGKRADMVSFRDITERKQAEEALRKSEEKYRRQFDEVMDAIFVADAETGILIDCNRAACKLVGWEKSELVGKPQRDLHPPEKTEGEFSRTFKQHLKEKEGQILETQVITKKGEIKDVAIKANLFELRGRKVLQGSFRDITEQKRAEEEVKTQRARFKSIFDHSLEGIVTLDISNNILNANPGFENIYGYKLEEIKGKRLDDLIVPQRFYHTEAKELDKMALGRILGYETIRKRKDGTEINVSLSAGPIKVGQETTGRFVIFHDITERKKAQEQLERSFVDLAETVSRAMSSRDPYTASHQRRVAELARLVGEKMGLDKDRLRGLYIGGLLHDIGKISTPESILSKPGQLAEEEWALIHAHAMRGYEILDGSRFPWPVADMALHHHERLDGSGYPNGISGDKLSLENRILGVCDVVEAMSSHRPYRPARSEEEVLEEIKNGRGTKYDANVVDVMLEIIQKGEFDFSSS